MWKLFIAVVLIATVLVTIWFKDGYVLGVAEGILPFYKISRYFAQTQYAWTEYPGLGSFASVTTASKPTYWLLSFIQEKGVEGFIIQAFVFWFLLVSAGIGIALLVKHFFPHIPLRYIFLTVLFYWFNPIFLVNVWNRFLLNYMFFFALMPVATFIFLKGLDSKKLIYSLIFALCVTIYSYTFSSHAFAILLWLTLSLFVLLFFILTKDKQTRFFYIEFFSLSLLFFMLTNAWWFSQMLTFAFSGTFQAISDRLFTTEINSGILKHLSKEMGNLTDILRLINNSFYTSDSPLWVSIYNSPFLILIHFVLVGAILYVSFAQITNPAVLILTSLFFLSIVLSKGINPPLGEVYGVLFQNIKFLQIFRNPFEKFSLLIPLFSSSLFCFSIFYYSKKFPSLKRLVEFLSIAIIAFWGFPYFSGLIFTNTTLHKEKHAQDYQVQVPPYYEKTNTWLESQSGNFRFLGLPIADEGITYLWEKGYRGADLPTTIYSTPGIIFNTSVPYYSKLVPEIDKIFFENEDFSKVANLLNIRFYLIRFDIDWEERSLKDPYVVLNRLQEMQKKQQVTEVANFDKISIWENLRYKDNTFYIATDIIIHTAESPSDILLADTTNNRAVVYGKPYWLEKVNQKKEGGNKTLEISYQKINPTKYIVHIFNSDTPFLLVFSELFDPNWQAKYINNPIISNHHLTNTYANGWWIEKSGTYDIQIEFIPQRYLYLGQRISFYTLTVAAMIVLYKILLIRRKWKA